MTDSELEQYKILTSSYNDEVTRFWWRFNILMGVQMGGFIGILAAAKLLVLNPMLFRLAVVLMTLYSIATLLIVVRGHSMHEMLLRALATMEKESMGTLRILSLVNKLSKVAIGFNQVVAMCIAMCFTLTWCVLLVYAESKGYAFALER